MKNKQNTFAWYISTLIRKNNRTLPGHLRLISVMLGFFAVSMLLSCSAATDTPVSDDTMASDVTFVAFDTETTGGSANDGRVIEIGAVKFRDGKEIDEKSWLIKPNMRISYWAEQCHHISPEMLKDSPVFAEVYPEFLEFIDGSVLFAHNAPFDIRFIRQEALRNNLEPPTNAVLDSLPLFRNWFPEMKSHSLESLSAALDVDEGTHHRATDDSRFILFIYNKGVEKLPAKYTYEQLTKDANGVKHF